MNPLSKYGFSYVKTYGEHESFQHIQLYLDKGQKRVTGPEITGDELYVRYEWHDKNDVPDIVVQSSIHMDRFATMRLNLYDAQRPEFEIVDNRMMTISYSPLGYYWP